MNFKRLIEAQILALLFLIIFAYAISGMQGFVASLTESASANQLSASISGAAQNSAEQNFGAQQNEEPQINAKAAISFETNLSGTSSTLFEKQSSQKLPIASLTKLMTAIVVLDNYNLSDTAVVSAKADAQSPMKQDVKPGQVMPVKNFLDIMLVGSSNKAAYTLADLMGVEKFVGLMNNKAQDIGLKNTFFVDPTGLSPQNVSTASELAQLTEYILKQYPQIAQISRIKELYIPKFGNIVNTDDLLSEPVGAVFSKTGFTNEANGCLILAVKSSKNNDYIINVVLGADDRFAEMQKLISQYQ